MDSLLRHRGETEVASPTEQPASDAIYKDDLSLRDSTEPSSNNTEIRDSVNRTRGFWVTSDSCPKHTLVSHVAVFHPYSQILQEYPEMKELQEEFNNEVKCYY